MNECEHHDIEAVEFRVRESDHSIIDKWKCADCDTVLIERYTSDGAFHAG